ncbi:MAG TPA: hypothetical protein VL461_09965 [Dictyobacter sp.]|nr:hypothetical protein [Dictyobacter sp.]
MKISQLLLNIGHVATIIITILGLLSGITLLCAGPRIVKRVAHATTPNPFTKSFFTRWVHLFFVEAIACLILYTTFSSNGWFLPQNMLTGILIVPGMAFCTSCILAYYI